MATQEEKQQARKAFKEKGLRIFTDQIRDEFRAHPGRATFHFLLHVGIMFAIVGGLYYVNNNLLFCEITSIELLGNTTYFDGSYMDALPLWEDITYNMSTVDYLHDSTLKHYTLTCTYNVTRGIDTWKTNRAIA